MDIINELGKINKEANIGDFSTVFYNRIAPSNKETDYLNTNTGWVYACTNVIADEVAKIDLRLYRKKGGEVEVINEHPLLDLLSKANNFTTKFDLFWLTQQYLELAGEAPWFVVKKGEIPVELYLLRPDQITVKAGTGENFIDGYTFRNDRGKEIPIASDEMIFLKYPSTTNQFRGTGTLSAAARVVDIEQYSEEYNKNYFYNSATPSMYFKTEQKLNDSVRNRFKKQIEQNYKGVANAHKFLILEAGLDAKPLTLSQKDMDFINQLNWTRDKILGIFRVPRTALGITDDVNRANAEATDYVFAKRTVQPKLARLVQQLNEFLIPMFPDGDSLWLDFEDPIPEDTEKKVKYYETGLKSGFLTINEVRGMENLESIGDKGDQIFLPLNLMPIDRETVLPEIKQNILKIKSGINTRNKKATKERFKKVVEEVVSDNVREIKKEVAEIVKNEEVRKDKVKMKWSDNKKIENWEMVIKRATKNEMRMRKAAAKQFRRQAKEVLKYKKKALNKKDWLLDEDKEKAIWHRIFLPIYTDIIREEGQAALNSVASGLTFNVMADARDFIDNKTAKLSWEVNKTTNKEIKKILKENIKEHEEVIARKIKEKFEYMETDRAKTIGRTETFKAVNYAMEEGFNQSGVVEAKEWFTGLDERTCQFCRPMEGTRIKLGSSYFKRGEFVVGDEGGTLNANYETILNPPLHCNCRCDIVPVMIGQKAYNKIIKLKKQDQAQEAKDIEIKKLQNELDEKEKEQGKQFSKVNKELKDIKEMNEKELGKIAENVKDLLDE